MLGKYSPTVSQAYWANQDWWDVYAPDGLYDPEGYDMYGYNKYGMDRAGNHKDEYAFPFPDCVKICPCCGNQNTDNEKLYYDTLRDWDFDGVKPAKRKK